MAEQGVLHELGTADHAGDALATVLDGRLDEGVRLEAVDREVVANAQIASEAGCQGQFGAYRNGDALQLRVQAREFRIQVAEGTRQGQGVGGGPLEIHVQTGRGRVAHVLHEEQEGHVRRVEA